MQEAERLKMEHSAKNALFFCKNRCFSQVFLQNFVDLTVGQLLAAACGDVGGICDSAEVSVIRDAKLCKAGRQADLLDERGQRVNTSGSGLFISALGRDAPDILCPAHKPRRTGLVDVTVQNRVDDRQTRTVVAVRVSAELVLDLMCLKKCGMSIQEMKDYLALCLQGERTIPQRLLLAQKQEALRAGIRELQDSVAYIDWKQNFYDEVLSGKRPYESNLIRVEK